MVETIEKTQLGYSAPFSSLWMIVTSIALGCIVYRLYRKERGVASPGIRLFLMSVRTLVCTLILLSILNWHLVSKKYQRQQLLLIFDHSISLNHLDEIPDPDTVMVRLKNLGFDKPTRLNILKKELLSNLDLLGELKKRFDLKIFRIGESLRQVEVDHFNDFVDQLKADEPRSFIDKSLNQLLKNATGQQPAAMVLFTDGLDSVDRQFHNLRRTAKATGIPVYPIGLGSKNPAKDLAITGVQANRKVFLNDLVEFQISIAADGLANRESRIQILDTAQGQVLLEKKIKVTGSQYRDHFRYKIRMKHGGSRKILVKASPVEGEYEFENNEKEITIDVKEDQLKVLLASNYPSREFHYLKQFLGREAKPHPDSSQEFARNRIQLDTFLQQADIEYAGVDRHAIKLFPVTRKQLFEYDVVVFCDLKPNWAGNVAGGLGKNELINLRDFVENHGGGVIFIAGPRYTPKAYINSPIEALFPIDLKSLKSPVGEVLKKPYAIRKTTLGNQFLPMEIGTEEASKSLHEFPGTFWFASSTGKKSSARVLATLDSASETVPAIVMQTVGNGSVLYHAFPETYRWRFRSSDLHFGRYWSQMIQYMASSKLARGDQGLVLETDRQQYFHREPVNLIVNVYDQSKTNNNFFSVTLQNRSGLERHVSLQQPRAGQSFSATVDNLSAGTYKAFLASDKEVTTSFQILNATREDQRFPVNETHLKNLAKQTGGYYFDINRLGELDDALPRKSLVEIGGSHPWVLWHHWEFTLIFGTSILLLVSIEWIVRKRVSML